MVSLSEVAVGIVASDDEARFRDLMEARHYLGALLGVGEWARPCAMSPTIEADGWRFWCSRRGR